VALQRRSVYGFKAQMQLCLGMQWLTGGHEGRVARGAVDRREDGEQLGGGCPGDLQGAVAAAWEGLYHGQGRSFAVCRGDCFSCSFVCRQGRRRSEHGEHSAAAAHKHLQQHRLRMHALEVEI